MPVYLYHLPSCSHQPSTYCSATSSTFPFYCSLYVEHYFSETDLQYFRSQFFNTEALDDHSMQSGQQWAIPIIVFYYLYKTFPYLKLFSQFFYLFIENFLFIYSIHSLFSISIFHIRSLTAGSLTDLLWYHICLEQQLVHRNLSISIYYLGYCMHSFIMCRSHRI